MEPEEVQPGVSVAVLEDVELSEPAAQATAAAPAAEAVTTMRLVSEALSALVLTLEAGVPGSEPAAVEPAAATVAASAASRRLSRESGQCWLMDQRQPRKSAGFWTQWSDPK